MARISRTGCHEDGSTATAPQSVIAWIDKNLVEIAGQRRETRMGFALVA